MDNNTVIIELKKCVTKLEGDKEILKSKRKSIPADNDILIQQKAELTSLIAEMDAKKSFLQTIINEREAADAGSIRAFSLR